VTSLQARPASAPAFVTSEQDVYLANRGKPAPVVTAVYPGGATSMLDFPMVRVAPAGSDPLVTAAMAQFERQLTTDAARAQFAADRLRDPSGASLTVDTTGAPRPSLSGPHPRRSPRRSRPQPCACGPRPPSRHSCWQPSTCQARCATTQATASRRSRS
jgi:hypothetical protein